MEEPAGIRLAEKLKNTEHIPSILIFYEDHNY